METINQNCKWRISPVRRELVSFTVEWCISCQQHRAVQIRLQSEPGTGPLCNLFCSVLKSLHCSCSCRQGHWGVPGLPKASCYQNHIFFHKPGLKERKDWSWAHRQELCEFQVWPIGWLPVTHNYNGEVCKTVDRTPWISNKVKYNSNLFWILNMYIHIYY